MRTENKQETISVNVCAIALALFVVIYISSIVVAKWGVREEVHQYFPIQQQDISGKQHLRYEMICDYCGKKGYLDVEWLWKYTPFFDYVWIVQARPSYGWGYGFVPLEGGKSGHSVSIKWYCPECAPKLRGGAQNMKTPEKSVLP